MQLSLRWAERCAVAFGTQPGKAMFGIVQGGMSAELRRESLQRLTEIGFDGYAIGGLAVGEPEHERNAMLDHLNPLLPADRPRYLMGVGRPSDLIGAVRRGIDMFDCVLPTRSGRTGQAFTRRGTVNLRNARHADDPRPLDEACTCPACRSYSRAYLHHLVRAGETLGAMLLSEINVAYYQELMQGIRDAVQLRILRRIGTDFRRRAFAIGIVAFERGAIALRPEARKPDARLLSHAAAHEADGASLEADSEDFRDLLEILIDGIVPIVVEAALAIPGAGIVFRGFGKLVEPIDRGFDDVRHRGRLRPERWKANRRCRSSPPSRRWRGRGHARRPRTRRFLDVSRYWRIASPIARSGRTRRHSV